jgi:rubrerythrin
MAFDLSVPDPEQTKAEVEQQLAVEPAHAELIDNAASEKGEQIMWECRNCGHLVVGKKAPEVCPVCNHPQSYFEVRKANY